METEGALSTVAMTALALGLVLAAPNRAAAESPDGEGYVKFESLIGEPVDSPPGCDEWEREREDGVLKLSCRDFDGPPAWSGEDTFVQAKSVGDDVGLVVVERMFDDRDDAGSTMGVVSSKLNDECENEGSEDDVVEWSCDSHELALGLTRVRRKGASDYDYIVRLTYYRAGYVDRIVEAVRSSETEGI